MSVYIVPEAANSYQVDSNECDQFDLNAATCRRFFSVQAYRMSTSLRQQDSELHTIPQDLILGPLFVIDPMTNSARFPVNRQKDPIRIHHDNGFHGLPSACIKPHLNTELTLLTDFHGFKPNEWT